MRKRRSITFLLTLYFSIASTAVLLFGGYFVGRLVDAHLTEQDQAVLEGKLELVRNVLTKARTNGDFAAVRESLAEALVGHHESIRRCHRTRRQTLVPSESFELGTDPAWSAPPADASDTVGSGVREHGPVLFASSPPRPQTGIPDAQPAAVVVALDIDFSSPVHERVPQQPVARGSCGHRAVCAARLVLRAPLAWRPSRKGARVDAARLGRSTGRAPTARLDSAGARPLAAAFNDMLARLEDSFRRLSEFSSDLAHELRTPISNLMTQNAGRATPARARR